MAPKHARIVVADLATPWLRALVSGLEQVESAVRVTELGQELRRALEEVVDHPRIIVVGQALQGIGGLEALYQAHRTLILEKKVRPSWPARAVSLITEVRSDTELLELHQRRGVTQFIYRDDPIERTIATLLANLTPASRVRVRMDANVSVEGQLLQGAVFDVSRTGAQIVVSADELRVMPLVGARLVVQLLSRQKFDCPAEIRRISSRKATQGLRLVMGVEFSFLEEEASEEIERIVSEVEEFELMSES